MEAAGLSGTLTGKGRMRRNTISPRYASGWKWAWWDDRVRKECGVKWWSVMGHGQQWEWFALNSSILLWLVVGGGAIGKLGRESVGIGHRGLNSRLAG